MGIQGLTTVTTSQRLDHFFELCEKVRDDSKDIIEMETMLENQPSLANGRKEGYEPLHKVAGKSAQATRLLLKYGANVASTTAPLDPARAKQRTPLHFAAQFGQVESARSLLEQGASVLARDGDLSTPLHTAASFGEAEVVHLLVEAGSEIEAINQARQTSLHSCGTGEKAAAICAQILLKAGAFVESRDINGSTPLMAAVGSRSIPVVQLFLNPEVHADVNAQNTAGNTPLHLLCSPPCLYSRSAAEVEKNTMPLAKLLLQAGASPELENKESQVPLFLALATRKIELMALFATYTTKSSVQGCLGGKSFL